MPKPLDLVGNRYGYTEVLYKNGHDTHGKVLWHCKCHAPNCGKEFDAPTYGLTHYEYKSCGCQKGNRKTHFHLEGERVNSLTVLEYVGKSKWKCRCDCGNITIKTSCDLKNKRAKTCGKCTSQIFDMVDKPYGDLIGRELAYVKDGRAYWRFECICGNTEYIANGKDVREGKIISCGHSHVNISGSNEENEIKIFIESLGQEVKKARKILDGKEIDIFVSNKNIGIEYNGSKVHASLGNPFVDKDKYYHRDKFLQAKEKGIHLISIFDVDWNTNQEKIKMYLRSLFLPQESIMARKCGVKKVSNDTACEFVEKYHLQGANKATMKINYGLYYEGELYAVMSFGKLRLKNTEEGQYELHRYCVKDGYIIVGGAKKLLSAFEKEYNPKYILSYSDNDYFTGDIYSLLGFDEKGQSFPRYYWYLHGKERRRESCMLKKLKQEVPELLQEAIDNNVSNKEDYVMLKRNACKVYRCGNTKWEKYYN